PVTLPAQPPRATEWGDRKTRSAMKGSTRSMAVFVPVVVTQYCGVVREWASVSPYPAARAGAMRARKTTAPVTQKATAPSGEVALRGCRTGLSLHPGAAVAARLIGRGRRSWRYALARPVEPQVIARCGTGVRMDRGEGATGRAWRGRSPPGAAVLPVGPGQPRVQHAQVRP